MEVTNYLLTGMTLQVPPDDLVVPGEPMKPLFKGKTCYPDIAHPETAIPRQRQLMLGRD